VRYLVEQPARIPLFSEEVRVLAFSPREDGTFTWLEEDEALRLLAEARPDANLPLPEKHAMVAAALEEWPALEEALTEKVEQRASDLE